MEGTERKNGKNGGRGRGQRLSPCGRFVSRHLLEQSGWPSEGFLGLAAPLQWAEPSRRDQDTSFLFPLAYCCPRPQ